MILGILKSGGAYVPIDPAYPLDRIGYMLEDTGADVVVSSKESREKVVLREGVEVIEIDGHEEEISKQSTANLQDVISPEQLAYVIYTSGSTGKPKGVMIEHRSVLNLLVSVADKVQFGSKSVFLSVTTYSFDISYLELYMPLIYGGKLVIVSRQSAKDGYRLAEKYTIRSTYPHARHTLNLAIIIGKWLEKRRRNKNTDRRRSGKRRHQK